MHKTSERPATSEPTGITFGKIIASIEKVLKTTKSLNKKEQLLQWEIRWLKISIGQLIQIIRVTFFVKSISGAKSKCVKSYIIPNVEHEPGAIVIHCRTNDLRRQGQLEEIACEIANLASSVKSKKNEVVSGIIPCQGVCQIFFRNFIVFKGFFSIFWLFFRVLLKIPSEYLSRSTGSENFQTNIKIEDSLTKNG